jgi:hypothetical protein
MQLITSYLKYFRGSNIHFKLQYFIIQFFDFFSNDLRYVDTFYTKDVIRNKAVRTHGPLYSSSKSPSHQDSLLYT